MKRNIYFNIIFPYTLVFLVFFGVLITPIFLLKSNFRNKGKIISSHNSIFTCFNYKDEELSVRLEFKGQSLRNTDLFPYSTSGYASFTHEFWPEKKNSQSF